MLTKEEFDKDKKLVDIFKTYKVYVQRHKRWNDR